MEALRFSFVLLFLFGFLYTANSNPITGWFGKSDDKAETDEKTDEKTAVAVKAAGDATTTTTAAPEASSSCGGLKGFLHICEKSEPTEPPKSVKTRSVPEEDDSDSDEKDSDENSEEKEKPQQGTETSEGVAKRQVEDSEAPILGEVPPMVGDGLSPPVEPSEGEEKAEEKRQAEDSDSTTDSVEDDEVMEVAEGSRRRRDCRDGGGDYWKNCRKRREYVPTCTRANCRDETTERQ